MEQLTIKELAPYLPYQLQCQFGAEDESLVGQLTGIMCGNNVVDCRFGPFEKPAIPIQLVKPLLHDLSMLTETMEYRDNTDLAINFICTSNKDRGLTLFELENGLWDRLAYWKIERLNEMHFDYRQLIGLGLALDKSKVLDNYK